MGDEIVNKRTVKGLEVAKQSIKIASPVDEMCAAVFANELLSLTDIDLILEFMLLMAGNSNVYVIKQHNQIAPFYEHELSNIVTYKQRICRNT